MSLLTESHENRLRHLIGSWSVRARPGMPGQQPQLLLGNIEAVEAALKASHMAALLADNFVQTQEALKFLKRDVQQMIRADKPVTPDALTGIVDQIDDALSALEDKL